MKMSGVYLIVLSVFILASCCLFIDTKGNVDPGVYEDIFDVLSELSVNAEGWTEINSSPDTRVIYVSSSTGDDSNNGLSEDTAVASLEMGYSLMRSGYPDHLLLKCGDTWAESISGWALSGRSENEPVILSSYGTGERPMICDGNSMRFSTKVDIRHVQIIGIDFYNNFSDPSSSDYDPSFDAPAAFTIKGDKNQVISDILLEDCRFRFYGMGLGVQDYMAAEVSNIKLRRSVISDNYSISSHSQGFYAHAVNGLLIEECLFDHNGWLIQGDGQNTIAGGMATMFNHNTYISTCNQVYIKGNLFLRGASMGNKMRSDERYGSVQLVFDNNFYYDGEIGISIGGNNDEQDYRYGNVEIINNVFYKIGLNRNTGRSLGWGIEMMDNFNALVSYNCFIHQPILTNSYALQITGISNRDISISHNVVYNINSVAFSIVNNPSWKTITVHNNRIADAGNEWTMMRVNNGFANLSFSNNNYNFSDTLPFSIANTKSTYENWLLASNETGASVSAIEFPDPDCNLETYYHSIGADGSDEDFISAAKEQSKTNWNTQLTASAVNAYIRRGFAASTVESEF